MHQFDRRYFLAGSLLFVSTSLIAGGGGSSSGTGPDNSDSFTAGNVDGSGHPVDGSGHPHTFTVNCSDLVAEVDKTYTATLSGHTHPVTISAAQFDTLSGEKGAVVTIMTVDQHPHTWTISRPAGACT